MAIIDMANSRISTGTSSMVKPVAEEKTSGFRLTATTSSYPTTDQKPGPAVSAWNSIGDR
ncbi:hypothetical protein QNA29_31200 [Rhodococcus opacus]|nr:hypothetical protein [Rhodococcus opacus]MDJ0418845.1 hypothetical protein [Rhodococcus opacus]